MLGLLPAAATAVPPQQKSSHAGDLKPSHLAHLKWRGIGPAFISGRIADIEAVENNPDIVYVASSVGGLWKSTDRGSTLKPIFDRGGTASLGSLAIGPSNPNLLWLGSGETWNWRSVSWGDGVYKSEDGGKTWKHKGLAQTRHIGQILIHPEDPDTVYVAGGGALWGANEERGVFKTTDGGETWKKVLYVSAYTGVVDLAMDPRNPDWLYAAAFQRERRVWSFLGGGPESGIHRSKDGGETWSRINNGLPKGDMGKIGLSVCRSMPDRVYAAISAGEDEGGLYRSDDRGASWERVSDSSASKVRCDPNDPDRVYILTDGDNISIDGGRTFAGSYKDETVHVDQQAMWIDPGDSNHIYIGNDGGFYMTDNGGKTWEFAENLPVSTFYTVAVDQQEPFYYVYGGTQDNGSMGGPSGTRYTDGIANEDWYRTSWGDGFFVQIDPEDPTIVYSESQYGRLVRFSTISGERKLIQPVQPEEGKYRWNWSSPLHISRYDNRTLYFAANVVFKSPDRGDSWEVISPDLTRKISHFDLPLQGKVQPRDAFMLHRATSDYGNITTFSESSRRQGLLAVGTDDGLIHVTRDDGGRWTEAKIPADVPERTFVSRVVWSHHDDGTLYATFEGHKDNNFLPYVFRSEDYGANWKNITGDLPEFGPVRVIVEHPRNRNLLFVGTESTAFLSITSGGRWIPMKESLPTVPVHDMVIQTQKNDLVIGTHGRGFFILDDITILEELSREVLASDFHLATLRPAYQIHRTDRGRAYMGHTRFKAPNPPDGALISYYVNPAIMKPQGEEGSQSGKIELDVLDGDGSLVRRLDPAQGAKGTGIQRVVWDLRHSMEYQPGENERVPFFRGSPRGPFVLPGTYRVRLRIGGEERTKDLQVRGDPAIEISEEDRRAWHGTLQSLNRMMAVSAALLSTTRAAETRLGDIRRAMETHGEVPVSVRENLAALSGIVDVIIEKMLGKETDGGATLPGAPPLANRVRQLYSAIEAATALPTADQRRLTRLSQEELGELISRVNQLTGTRLPAFEQQLDEAGVPWTPGRPISLKAEPLPPPR
jgi:photosystem II stability/assembly factor-like uncharacterized protein